ncbi:MAG: hypothetical protein IJL89_07690 [Firmicutes bacterium]|nr:hypothetical protein [Bacillota bacterium]
MDYNKVLEEYAKEIEAKIKDKRIEVSDGIFAWTENNTIRIRDERNENKIYELPFEESSEKHKSRGLFYSAETEEYYKSFDDIIDYVKSGVFLKDSSKKK